MTEDTTKFPTFLAALAFAEGSKKQGTIVTVLPLSDEPIYYKIYWRE